MNIYLIIYLTGFLASYSYTDYIAGERNNATGVHRVVLATLLSLVWPFAFILEVGTTIAAIFVATRNAIIGKSK